MDLPAIQMETPAGPVLAVADEAGACAVDFLDSIERVMAPLRRRYGPVEPRFGADPHRLAERLRAYFAGEYDAIDDAPVSLGGTEFQRSVWAALRKIPVGTTLSYGGLAARVGSPGGMRAVGQANGRNPVAIIVPCHRVIGADAGLAGYGGGVARKRWLLTHEGLAVSASGRVSPPPMA